ncbi:MAG: SH3 domain-containing protein [Arenicellales bacterium]|nr:SH3 domain-containing protein [Arenicellales bacterium]
MKIALNFGYRLRWPNPTLLVILLSCGLIAGCAELQWGNPGANPEPAQHVEEAQPAPSTPIPAPVEIELLRRAEIERVRALEREVERLKIDLERAEDALVGVETELRSGHSRANAVSSLAEAQMQLNKAARTAPWRAETISEARDKLDIAQKHIDNEYFGAAVFFVYRASRIVEELNHEADIVGNTSQVMFINRPRVNLRSGPSKTDEILTILVRGTPVVKEKKMDEWFLVRTLTGIVGWVHYELVTSKERYKASFISTVIGG